jgi:peptide/nickel transport system permease protein
MRQYLVHRLLQLIPTLVIVSLIVFAIMRALPGDVALLVAAGGMGAGEASGAQIREEELQEIREILGLNDPLWQQYLTWMGGIVTLDWGDSLVAGRPIGRDVLRRLPVTLELAVLTSLFAVLAGVPLGVVSAMRRGTWADYSVRLLALGGLSVPNFWLATLLLMAGLAFFGWIPRVEYVGLFQDPLANLGQLIWPALVLGYSAAAIISRMTRSALLDALGQDYIRTAWAKGLRQRQVLYRHALKNALLPVITIIGVLFVTLAGGSVLMEQIFVIPGLGLYLLDGVRSRDYAVVQTLVLLFAVGVLLVNLAVDLAYAWLDPRIRFHDAG